MGVSPIFNSPVPVKEAPCSAGKVGWDSRGNPGDDSLEATRDGERRSDGIAAGLKGAKPADLKPPLKCSGLIDFSHNSLTRLGKMSLVTLAALVLTLY